MSGLKVLYQRQRQGYADELVILDGSLIGAARVVDQYGDSVPATKYDLTSEVLWLAAEAARLKAEAEQAEFENLRLRNSLAEASDPARTPAVFA